MTFARLENMFTEGLKNLYSREEAGSISWLVISSICGITRSQYQTNKHRELSEQELALFDKALKALKTGTPVQYVLGETEFYDLTFKVNPAVLIPRPETEELVDWVLKDIGLRGGATVNLKILDIGTGSGCIPISLAKNLPGAEVTALDISTEALALATENASLNHTHVVFMQENILSPKPSTHKYHIITSNPPYVTLAEKAQMHINVLDYEPHLALFVPDDDPLLFYRAIATFAFGQLEPEGILYLEINEALGKETVFLLQSAGFTQVELRRDLRNNDRMIRAQL
jgi:release factor glutamine methyltransferase